MDVTCLTTAAEAFTGHVYLVEGETPALVDAGAMPGVVEAVRERVPEIVSVALTHRHDDHVAQLPALREAFDPTVAAAEPAPGERGLADGDRIELGDEQFEVVATPGHAGGARVTRVAILSDTHLPAAGGAVPDWVAEALDTADHALHAGDFLTAEAHFELRVLASGDMTSVRGNRDPRLPLPTVETVDLGGVRFVLTHGNDIGRGATYEDALVDLAAEHDADVAVAGHTHSLLDTTRDGVRILNPGSATGAPPADAATILLADCEAGDLTVTTRRDPGDFHS